MTDIELAKQTLKNEGLTCAAVKDGEVVFRSIDRGVKPLVQLYDLGCGSQSALADKVIGRAAALLLCQIGVREMWAGVMSRSAARELDAHGIANGCADTVPAIRNRDNTGLCPMEKLAEGVQTPEEMLSRVRGFLESIAKGGR